MTKTKYPSQLDNNINFPPAINNITPINADAFNRLRDAILAIEKELGVKPSSLYSTVRGRLDVLESMANSPSGTIYDGYTIRGYPISTTPPNVGEVLLWDGTYWTPTFLSSDDLSVAFDINSFLPTSTALIEVGGPLNNPAFTASYSSGPSGLSLIDSDNLVSQNVLGTPTSFSSAYSFTKNTFGATVTFTLDASKNATYTTVNKSAEVVKTWGQKLHWGVGVAGQTSNSFILSLSGESISITKNVTFTVTANSSQKIYFACRTAYGVPVISINGIAGGFSATFTGPLTNTYGFTENYTIYESDNLGLGLTTVEVT